MDYENYTLSDFSDRNFEWAMGKLAEIDRQIRRERILDRVERVIEYVGLTTAPLLGFAYVLHLLVG